MSELYDFAVISDLQPHPESMQGLQGVKKRENRPFHRTNLNTSS